MSSSSDGSLCRCTICGEMGAQIPQGDAAVGEDDAYGRCTKCEAKRCLHCLRWFKDRKLWQDHQNLIHKPARLVGLSVPGFCPGCSAHADTSGEKCSSCGCIFKITRAMPGTEGRVFRLGEEVRFRRTVGGFEDRGVIVEIPDQETVVVCYVNHLYQASVYDETKRAVDIRAWDEVFAEKRERRPVIAPACPEAVVKSEPECKPKPKAKLPVKRAKVDSEVSLAAEVKEVAKAKKPAAGAATRQPAMKKEKAGAAKQQAAGAQWPTAAKKRAGWVVHGRRPGAGDPDLASDSDSDGDAETSRTLAAHGLAMARPSCLSSGTQPDSCNDNGSSCDAARASKRNLETAVMPAAKVRAGVDLGGPAAAEPDMSAEDLSGATCEGVLRLLEGLFRPEGESLTRYCFDVRRAYVGRDRRTVLARADYHVLRALVFDVFHWIGRDVDAAASISGFSVRLLLEILVMCPRDLWELVQLPMAELLCESVQVALVRVLADGLARRGASLAHELPSVEELLALDRSFSGPSSIGPAQAQPAEGVALNRALAPSGPTAKFSVMYQRLVSAPPGAGQALVLPASELTVALLRRMNLTLPLPYEIFEALNRILEERSNGLKDFEGSGNLAEYFDGKKSMYGRVYPPLVQALAERARIGGSDRFLDIGSGIAQTCVQIAATACCAECVGIEHNRKYHKGALELVQSFDALLEEIGVEARVGPKVRLICGDVLEHLDEVVCADVVFFNNFGFHFSHMDADISSAFKKMKVGSHILSMETFEGLPSVRYEEFETGQGVTSWTHRSITMKHYELLTTTWVCKNVSCQHENLLQDSVCVKCKKVSKTSRGVNIHHK